MTMDGVNWANMQSGAAFEALAHQLLFRLHGDQVLLFDRLGPDAGQDARTRDGKIVYQAKFQSIRFKMNDAVLLALEELESIKRYRVAGHANHNHWSLAQQWYLVAPFEINPKDDAAWTTRVVPAFHAENLEATYWHRERIEAILADHQELIPLFFGGRCRVYSTLYEAREWLGRSNAYLGESLGRNLIGRETEMAVIDRFVADETKWILPIIGHSGIGKTRFLFEAGRHLQARGISVLWANVATMDSDPDWFAPSLGTGKRLVLIDEPSSPKLLAKIKEQIGAPPNQHVRFLVACRSEQSDVLALLNVPSNPAVAEPLHLTPLKQADAKALLAATVGHAVDERWAHDVAEWTGGYPLWITIVAVLLREVGNVRDLPRQTSELALRCIESALACVPTDLRHCARTLLNWISVYGDISLADEEMISFLDSQEVRRDDITLVCASLAHSRLLSQGPDGKRSVAITPDALAEHIAARWLLIPIPDGTWEVSPAGRQVVQLIVGDEHGSAVPHVESILRMLAHMACSWLHGIHNVLLGPVFAQLEEMAQQAFPAQLSALAFLRHLGHADVARALQIIARIRACIPAETTPAVPYNASDETLSNLCSHLVIILDGLVEHASRSADCEALFDETMALLIIQHSALTPQQQAEHCSRCSDTPTLCSAWGVIKSVLKGNRHVEAYRPVVIRRLMRTLCDLQSPGQVSPFQRSVFRQLSFWACDPQWELNWVVEMTMTLQFRLLQPGGPAWLALTDFLHSICSSLQSSRSSAEESRLLFWEVLEHSRSAFSRALQHRISDDAPARTHYHTVLDLLLRDCLAAVSARELTVAEVFAARAVWNWHLKYGGADPLHAVAEACEALVRRNPLVVAFRLDLLCGDQDDNEEVRNHEQMRDLLLTYTEPTEYASFLSAVDACKLGGAHIPDTRLRDLAICTAEAIVGPRQAVLDAYAAQMIGSSQGSTITLAWHFAVGVVSARIRQARVCGEPQVTAALKRWFGAASNPFPLARSLYMRPHPRLLGRVSAVDAELLAGLGTPTNIDERRLVPAMLMTCVISAPEPAKKLFEVALDRLPDEHRVSALERSLENLNDAIIWHGRGDSQTDELRWVLRLASRQLGGAEILHRMAQVFGPHGTHMALPFGDYVQFLRAIVSAMKSEPDVPLGLHHDFNPTNLFVLDLSDRLGQDAYAQFIDLALSSPPPMRSFLLGQLCALDPSGNATLRNVAARISDLPECCPLDSLIALTGMASLFSDDGEGWRAVALAACRRLSDYHASEHPSLYRSLLPRGRGYAAFAGQVPPEIAARAREARELAATEMNPMLREYRQYARADADFLVKHYGRISSDSNDGGTE